MALNIFMIKILPNPHNQFTKKDITMGFSKCLTIENAISEETARDILAYGEQFVTPASNKHNHNFSIHVDTCWLPEDHKVHEELMPHWESAIKFFNFDVDFIEPYEIKKYPIKGHYSRHIDNYHAMDIPVDRKISMSLQLGNETDYEGGDLIIVSKKVSKTYRSITFFPSFYPHVVTPVTSGSRWVMIGWAWGPYWR